jgi:hypothetical protein
MFRPMPAAESTRSTAELSLLGELVFVGRSGPVELVVDPVHEAPIDADEDEDDYRYQPALTSITVTDSVPPSPSVREAVARIVALTFLAVWLVLTIALAIGYAAG